MSAKSLTLRSLAVANGERRPIDLELEFEEDRAYVVWDTIHVGEFDLKARIEIDPTLLRKTAQPDCDFLYRGNLVLPNPRHN